MKKSRSIVKRSASIMFILMLALVIVLSGCSGSESPGTDTKAKSDDTVYTLKMNVHTPDTIPPSLATKAGCDMAEELSNGRLKFEIYYSGNYVAYLDTLMGLSDHVIDMAMVDATMIAGSYTLNQVFSKPLKTAIPDRTSNSNAYRALLAETPELNEELEKDGIHWVSVGSLAGYNLHMKGTEVKTPDDLKGKKLDSLGDAVSYFTMLGAPSSALDPGDSYQALERNLVDGQVTHWALMVNFGTQDFLKYHTLYGIDDVNGESDGGLYAPLIGYAINFDTWNSLPEDLQQILVESFDFAGDEMGNMDIATIAEGKKTAQDRGDTFTYVNGDDLKPWYEWADKSNAEWFAACDALGYDGESVYKKLIEKIEAQSK
jgi:TRAP-type C4-dicarboxylate transport system substrate-binding protein